MIRRLLLGLALAALAACARGSKDTDGAAAADTEAEMIRRAEASIAAAEAAERAAPPAPDADFPPTPPAPAVPAPAR